MGIKTQRAYGRKRELQNVSGETASRFCEDFGFITNGEVGGSVILKRVFPFLVASLFLLPSITYAAHAVEGDLEGYVISGITIVRSNVFNLSDPKENTLIGRWGNKLHTVTKEKIIRNELLIREGDPFSKDLVEESERNLRRYSFLTAIRIKAVPDHKEKTVDLVVETRDQWSLLIGGTFGGTSENSETGVDLGDKNFRGSGQSVTYRMRHDNSGFAHSYGFSDPTLFDTRYAFSTGFKNRPKEDEFDIKLDRPFYSLDTKRAHGVSYLLKDHDERDLVFDSDRLTAYYGKAYDYWDIDVLRAKLIVSLGQERVWRGSNPKKVKRDNKLLGELEILINPREYAKETYIEKFRQVEDIALGTSIYLTAGPMMKAIGATSDDISVGFLARRNFKVGGRDYLFTSLSAAKNDASFNDHSANVKLKYYYRRFESHMLVMQLKASYLESDANRYKLGGTNGLRGYKSDEFSGQSQLTLNFEDRIFTRKSMFSGIVEPGFVVFADFGNAWRDSPGDNLKRLHGGFGAGIRFALLKAPGISLIRVDIGQSIEFERSPVVTIGMEGFF